MKAYIFQADVYCESCGDAIKARLDAEGKRPADAEDESSYDSDAYPKGPYRDGGGEADTPQHCGACHVFLENPLTGDGESYVRDALARNDGDSAVLHEWADYYDWIPDLPPDLPPDNYNATHLHAERLADWRNDVANGDTRLGFAEWCEHNAEAERELADYITELRDKESGV